MQIHEPATLITDYLLAVLALVLAILLGRRSPPVARARHWFTWALALIGLSAAIGGSYHGFAPNFGEPASGIWWWFTLLTLMLVSAALAHSLTLELTSGSGQPFVRAAILFKLVSFAAFAVNKPLFLVAIVDYGITLLAWLVAALAGHRPWKRDMLTAIALSGIAAAVQQLQLAPSHVFNHNDLYHVIQAFALMAFYRAGRRLSF